MADNRMVRVTNRTSKLIEVMVDGQVWQFYPGKDERNFVPRYVAVKAIERSPVMGTEDPSDLGEIQYKLAVEAWGNDVSPIEDREGALERFDRSLLPEDRQAVVRGIPAGLRQRVEAELGNAPGRGLRGMATPAMQGQGGENLTTTHFSDPEGSGRL